MRFFKIMKKIIVGLLTVVIAVGSIGALGVLAVSVALTSGNPETAGGTKVVDVALLDRYDMYVTNEISNALDGVLAIEKVYWLSDNDQVAPEPDQEKFGETDDPTTLQW